MNKHTPEPIDKITKNTSAASIKSISRKFFSRIKKLKGDPDYVAKGMAIGVFISITPTIPFHTVLALLLAFSLNGSKPAAVIGVWFSNPITIPFLYLASYKAGGFLLGNSIPFDQKYDSLLELMKLGMDVTLAMLVGGIIIGIPPALLTYGITKKIFVKIHSKKARLSKSKSRII